LRLKCFSNPLTLRDRDRQTERVSEFRPKDSPNPFEPKADLGCDGANEQRSAADEIVEALIGHERRKIVERHGPHHCVVDRLNQRDVSNLFLVQRDDRRLELPLETIDLA
jgi:hypothetical protein